MKIHSKENNPESQQHLNDNKVKFTKGCLKVLELLRQGKILTTMNAPGYGILSLPRRIKDLRDLNGIKISERWQTDENGRHLIKEWFLEPKTESENLYLTGKPTAADHASNIINMTQKDLWD